MDGSHIITIIRQLRGSPRSILDPPDTLQLDAFFHGFAAVDQRLLPVLRTLRQAFQGPDAMDVFTRAYLLFDDADGVGRILDALEAALHGMAWPAGAPGQPANRSVVGSVADAIEQGRPGLVMPEPSFFWLRSYSQGFIAALHGVDEELAARETAKFEKFESRLQQREGARVPWHRILHVYADDHSVRGMKRFMELWREFGLEV